MRTIHRLIEAKKAQREEEGKDAGFSLIELIIVVVILGILVAIAIPIFGNIQESARRSAVDTAAANGATAAAAAIASGDDVAAAIASAGSGDITVSNSATPAGSLTDATQVCVQAVHSGAPTEIARAGNLAGCNETADPTD